MKRFWMGIVAVLVMLGGSSIAMASPRDMLTAAAFQTRDKGTAIAQVAAAQAAAEAELRAKPGDREATLVRAMAIGYRAKLKRVKSDAVEARRLFEALAASDPRDPQAQLIIAGWHLDAIADVGRMLAGAVLGAKSATGLAALDRSVALGGATHAAYPAIASLMRIRLDSSDVARARQLAEMAVKAPVSTQLDRIMQRSAAAVLVPLRAGNGKAASALAEKLLPFANVK